MESIKITSNTIKLDQFLKWGNIVMSGGEAKHLIQAGEVEVNGEVELKRGRKLEVGDIVSLTSTEQEYKVSKG